MSLIPAFDIGVWNAWIMVIFYFIPDGLISLIYRGYFKRASAFVPANKAEKIVIISHEIIFWGAIVYSVFLPLKPGTAWFYAGLIIYLIAIAISTVSAMNFATTPPDKPVTRGIYRYSRHPIYLAFFLFYLGVGIAAVSWLYILLSVIMIALRPRYVMPEERFCLEKYGDTYREYVNRTPKWIGVPKAR